MKVTKVIADKFYKKEYVEIENAIFRQDVAIETYPKLKEAILKTSSEYKPAKDVKQITYRAFPSNNKMLDAIMKKRYSIYKMLNLNAVCGKRANVIKAWLLFDYLSVKLTYDMTSMEDSITKKTIAQKTIERYSKLYDEKVLLKQISMFAKSAQKREEAKKGLKSVSKELKQVETMLDAKEYGAQNRQYLKQIYNALIRDKGVCEEFHYAYQFLLNGLGINSFYAIIKVVGEKSLHAINLVEFKEDNETSYYIVDLTVGNSEATKNRYTRFNVLGFNEEKRNYFDEIGGNQICQLSYIKNLYTKSKNICVDITDEKLIQSVKDKIIKEYIFDGEAKVSANFENSGYKNYEGQKDSSLER